MTILVVDLLIDTLDRAPLPDSPPELGVFDLDGMIRKFDPQTGIMNETPGDILGLYAEMRKATGTLAARKKDGVKFKVRSAEEMIDKIRDLANALGVLIYPQEAKGLGYVVEDGTLASVELSVVLQAVSDGSRLKIAGFGLGADNQDKAGGKAGTYAFKQALVQAFLMGGKDNAKALGVVDTDDTDTPIAGGVKAKAGKPTVDSVRKAFASAESREQFDAAVKALRTLSPEKQMDVRETIIETKARLGLDQPTAQKDSSANAREGLTSSAS